MSEKPKPVFEMPTDQELLEVGDLVANAKTDKFFEEAARANPMLNKHRTLLLNADYQPLSYCPLSTAPWTQIFFWIAKGDSRVKDGGKSIITVLDVYEDIKVNGKYPLPSVVAFTEMVPLPVMVPFTRFNILLRDDFTCQYTGKKLPANKLTFDHVHPASRGGKTSWDNIVMADQDVNEAKGDRVLNKDGTLKVNVKGNPVTLRLIRPPYQPSAYELREKGKKYPPRFLHDSWRDYLYWDTELER